MTSTLSGNGQTVKPPGARRTEVLDAARQLFFDQGYRGTTIQQIASRAGYSKRTVYLDFQNKDELFMSLCAEGGELILVLLEQITSDELSVEESIDQLLDVFVSFSREHDEYFRMIFSEATPEIIANCTEPMRRRVAELERSCFGYVVGWVERAVRDGLIMDVDPWEAAGIFVGSATGIILLSMGGSQTVYTKKTRESLVKQAIRIYWQGLRAGRKAGA